MFTSKTPNNLHYTSKTPQKPIKKHQKSPKPLKNSRNIKIRKTSQNNRSRLFGKIIAPIAMVGYLQKYRYCIVGGKTLQSHGMKKMTIVEAYS